MTFLSRGLKDGSMPWEYAGTECFRQRNNRTKSLEGASWWVPRKSLRLSCQENSGWWTQRGVLGLDWLLLCCSGVDSGFYSKCNGSQERVWGVGEWGSLTLFFQFKGNSGCSGREQTTWGKTGSRWPVRGWFRQETMAVGTKELSVEIVRCGQVQDMWENN